MHSSGMRTARLLAVSQHALLWGGVPAWGGRGGGILAWGDLPGGVPAQGGCTCLGGVPALGGGGVYPPWGVPAWGVYLPRGVPAKVLPPCEQND